MRMPEPSVPLIPAADLARRLDQGEHLQLLDIRSAERVAQGRVTLGATLNFRALAASQLYQLATLEPLGLDPAAPVAVICRSEEHTSELQSQSNLVCRLLLEKKNTKTQQQS